jgi:predicted aconitase with swiveling domain/8-oxo-dGTP pyrophosphatase MutT (NUDIX family)
MRIGRNAARFGDAMKGRSISPGKGKGKAVILKDAFSFLGGVDTKTGDLSIATGMAGTSIKGNVFIFPKGRGSTVGSYTLLDMKKHGTQPSAIINERAETIVATGAVMSNVPMVDSLDLSLFRDGDEVSVDGDTGEVSIVGVKESRVVTSIVRHGGKILILKRSEKVGTNKGKWAGVSGYIENGEDPEQAASREIREELSIDRFTLIGKANPMMIREAEHIWTIYPFLFEAESENVVTDWEHTEHRWVQPDQVKDFDVVKGFENLLSDLKLL